MSATTSPAVKGRPRSFDHAEVLDALIQLFWEKGFEATSMTDIVEATGLNKSSLYNAFGPKEVLLQEALKRYVEAQTGQTALVLAEGTAGLADIHSLFDLLWHAFHANGDRRGCLAVNSSTELGLRDQHVAAIVRSYRDLTGDSFRAALRRAADQGEIEPHLVDTYVSLSVTTMLGLAVLVRSGADNDEVSSYLDATRHLVESWRLPSGLDDADRRAV